MDAGNVETRPSHGRAALAVLAALIPIIPIIVGFALTAGGTSAAPPPAPYVPAHAPLAKPAPNAGALVAIIRAPTTLRDTPDGHALGRITTKTDFGSPEVLWVVQRSGGWLGVVTPVAGNNRVGWIEQGATVLTHVPWTVRVSLSKRQLSVLDAGKVVRRFTVAVGRPSAPTPIGHFAVSDRLFTSDPQGPYGCCILALTAKSPHAIQGWSGGDRIAIHSTPEVGSIGFPVSHGCLRLTLAEGRWLLAHIPLGTPTLISA